MTDPILKNQASQSNRNAGNAVDSSTAEKTTAKFMQTDNAPSSDSTSNKPFDELIEAVSQNKNSNPSADKNVSEDAESEQSIAIGDYAESVHEESAERATASGKVSLFFKETLGKARRKFSYVTDRQNWAQAREIAARKRNTILFWSIAIIPAIITFLYALLFYSPMYITEAEFAVKTRGPQAIASSLNIASMLSGSNDKNVQMATAYVHSSDMFLKLDRKYGLIDHYTGHDPISSLSSNPTLREIADYWNFAVKTEMDADSELIRISVKAYDPVTSKQIADGILIELDDLVNKMNQKAMEDAIELAQSEVAKAQADVNRQSEKLRSFRNENTIIDPAAEAQTLMAIIGELETNLSKSRAELGEKLTYMREESVEIRSLRSRIASLSAQVEEARSRLAGMSGTSKLSESLATYEQLKLDHEFAKKMLESSMAALENARQTAITKTVYLVIVESPKLPDESLWPEPFKACILVFLIAVFGYGIISLLIASIREHMGV